MGGDETFGTEYPEAEAEDALRGREERSEGVCGPEGKGGAVSWRLSLPVGSMLPRCLALRTSVARSGLLAVPWDLYIERRLD